MFVFHGVWTDGALHVFAEDSARPASAPSSEDRAPRGHPFAPPAVAVADALPEIARKSVDGELTLRLPSAGGVPYPSPELGREPPPGRASLAWWRVPVLVFDPADAAELLAVLDSPPRSWPAGATITYLAAVARFAADLVDRGRVLPVLVGEDDGYAARWRPVLAAADAQRARELAAAMPPLLRSAEDPSPGSLLADLLDTFADSQARTRLPGPLVPAYRGRRPHGISYAERTIASLTAPRAVIVSENPEDRAEAEALARSLAGWLEAARLPAGPVRTCFRLIEPDEETDSGDWRVEFALQSAEDPSLMLPADEVWAGAGGGWLSAGVYPEEALLAGLGAAARLFGELDQALRGAAPAGVTLDTAGALRFLRETGPLLAGAGFGVLLPDWARKARLGLKLTTRSSSSGASSGRAAQFGLDDLVEFRYDLAVGDQTLSAEELAELAAIKV
ncbi:MAG: SNF2 helicase-associated domain-containing protein, partial [Nocardiopsaceae bacterium]|nr:SNF2 helicase-associated domain-containing protein [Nocardiopsaceae bacterium]